MHLGPLAAERIWAASAAVPKSTSSQPVLSVAGMLATVPWRRRTPLSVTGVQRLVIGLPKLS